MRDCALQGDTQVLIGARVHHGLKPNASELMALYARADLADQKFDSSRNYAQVLAVCMQCVDAG